MFEKIKKLYVEFKDVNKGLKVGDILIQTKQMDNPFQQTKIEVLDIKDGYCLYRHIIIDGIEINTGIKRSEKISDLLWFYSKIKS